MRRRDLMPDGQDGKKLVRTRQRVVDHGEVFTPSWLVEEMLESLGNESDRIDSRFLEPACGSGNFLVPVLKRKLLSVSARHGKSAFEKRHYALFALMCIYGIELLQDNAEECRENLHKTFITYLGVDRADEWAVAARRVLDVNVVQGDALTLTGSDERPIVFAEWGYIGKGRYQRRDFCYDNLTQRASFQGTLWENFEEHEVFKPTKNYPPMSVKELAQ